jgi:nucleolin
MNEEKQNRKKRKREEGIDKKDSHESTADSHTLAGTQYESLEEKVKSMVQKKLKQSQTSQNIKKSKISEKSEPKPVTAKTKAVSNTSSTNPQAQEYVNDRTVYIQGLPFTCEEDEVRNFFNDCGEIRSVRLARWHDSGKLKGYGHVEFTDESGAEKALELSGQYLKNRYLTVDRPMVPRSLSESAPSNSTATKEETEEKEKAAAGCRTVFIGNLPYTVTEKEIRDQFMVFGPINAVRLAVWNHTGNLKGFGYIEFKREDSAAVSVKKSGTIRLNDRIISVDYETAGPKRGYKGIPVTKNNSYNNNNNSAIVK